MKEPKKEPALKALMDPGVKASCGQWHQDTANDCEWVTPGHHREYLP